MEGLEKLIEECDKNFEFHTNHLQELRESIANLDEAKFKLQSVDPKMDFSSFAEAEHFTNYSGYVTITILELSVDLKNLILAKSDWECVFFIKNAYLIIHESIRKISPTENKSFIQLTIEKKYPSLKSQFLEIISSIDNFKSTVDYKKIEDTRHHTAGHIEKSLKKYYDTILKLNVNEAGQYISDYLRLLDKVLIICKDYAILAKEREDEKQRAKRKN